jgi:hypothetical protein
VRAEESTLLALREALAPNSIFAVQEGNPWTRRHFS